MAKLFRLSIMLCAIAVPFSTKAEAPLPLEGACFEMIPGNPKTLPGSPILLNKCTGDTFLLSLVRPSTSGAGKSEAIIKWVPIDRASAIQGKAKLKPSSSIGAKCFSYDGRNFCH